MTQSANEIPSTPSNLREKAHRDRRLANAIAMGLLILLIGGLAFFPPLLRKKVYAFPEITGKTPLSFPMNLSLPVRNRTGAVQSRTLREIMGSHPTAIVNLWATWCPPCVEELPSLEYLHRQLQALPADKGPLLVTLSVDEEYSDVSELFSTLDFKPSFLVLHDSTADLARTVGTFRFPETYWVDRDGNILHKWVGPQDWMGERVLSQLHEGLKPAP